MPEHPKPKKPKAQKQNTFKRPPKKYQPQGLSIVHEDRDLLVVDKECGLLTVGNDKVKGNSAYFLLDQYVRKGNQKSRRRVFIVHRLDRDTSGLLVFAKSEKAQLYLQDAWATFEKKYYAVVQGSLAEKEGVITSYLAENSACKMYAVDDPKKGKLAKTGYTVLRESAKHSLVEIDLLTGRKNQIRVQFAGLGCPVAGDKRYGRREKGIKRLTLHAASLTIAHPHTHAPLTFTAKVPAYFNFLLRRG